MRENLAMLSKEYSYK